VVLILVARHSLSLFLYLRSGAYPAFSPWASLCQIRFQHLVNLLIYSFDAFLMLWQTEKLEADGTGCENNAQNRYFDPKHQTVSRTKENAETRIPERFPAFCLWQGQKDSVSPAGSVGAGAHRAPAPLGTRFWGGCGKTCKPHCHWLFRQC